MVSLSNHELAARASATRVHALLHPLMVSLSNQDLTRQQFRTTATHPAP
jgi:hypothetical protein